MSLETTLARAEANAREQAWKAHKRECPQCSIAAGRRQWAALCPAGACARDAHQEAQGELAESRRLDKLPSPDQEALFLFLPPRASA